jgi:hypothetical protein
VGFVVCCGYIQSLNEEWVLLFVLYELLFSCVFWLYPEHERRVGFVVWFGYIQSLNEEWVLLFVLVISRV